MQLNSSTTAPESAEAAEFARTDERSGLRDPDDFRQTDVVIYDGHCGFCTAQVRRLQRWDTKKRLSFISLHDPRAGQRYPDLSKDLLMEQMYVVDQNGSRHGGAAAFKYLSRKLPRMYPLAPLLHLPLTMPMWQWFYREFARRRYWFGKSDAAQCEDGTCRIHRK